MGKIPSSPNLRKTDDCPSEPHYVAVYLSGLKCGFNYCKTASAITRKKDRQIHMVGYTMVREIRVRWIVCCDHRE